jgi:hypothetical protein
MADPDYRAAVVDLLAVLAYGELSAFVRLAADAAMAPTVADQAAMGSLAVVELGHFHKLRDRLIELGADPEAAIEPFRDPLDSFHASTAPNSWLEGLVKAYVGDGLGADFYRSIAEYLDADTKALVAEVLGDLGHNEFVVEHVRAAIAADPRVAGRLALWGRRLVGEALSQAQRVAAERDSLTVLFIGSDQREGIGLGGIGAIFNQLMTNHSERMHSMGLSA